MAQKGPRNSRPPRPRSLAQRKLRPGLPPTIALRTPQKAKPADKGSARRTDPPHQPTPHLLHAPAEPSLPAPAHAARRSLPAPAAHSLVLRGDYWELRYNGASAMVEDSRGLRYIAILIQRAAIDQRPIHARELVALATGRTDTPVELEARDELLDGTARAQLLKRLEDLATERDHACAADLLDRAAELDDEYERVALELRHAATGSGKGRRGAFTDAGEKARKAVGKAISEAVAKIGTYKEVAALADHLGTALRKGQWLSYTGRDAWEIEIPPALRHK